jgi:lipid-A-disaccharide synthase
LKQTYRIFISTGEVSGDLQGSLLIEGLLRQAEVKGIALEITALGGDRMAAAGATLLANTSAIGSVGLWESLPYVIPAWQTFQRTKQHLFAHPPNVVIMVDYLGPNVGLGNFLSRQLPDIPIVYYIAPQEWVWSLGEGKTTQIVEFADRILAVFPGEAQYYQQKGANVTWVGHPLLDAMQQWPDRATARQQLGIEPDAIAIALIPASRRQELQYLLPVMLAAAQKIQAAIPQAQFWIPLALQEYRSALETALDRHSLNAQLLTGQTQEILAAADVAITKSGTVNLELALQNIPQVVIYRVSRITAWIAVNLLRFSIPFMSPPNLILMEPIVPELLQDAATPDRIAQETLQLLQDPHRRQGLLGNYQRMKMALGEPGVCDRAATEILRYLLE